MGTTLSTTRPALGPKTFVAFSNKKMILAEYAERTGVEPGEPEYEFAKKNLTGWGYIRETWDTWYGNNLKNRFKVPWRPRAPHRWNRLKVLPFLVIAVYTIEWAGDRMSEIYEENNPENPVWMEWYQTPQNVEYQSKWFYDEMDKWKIFDRDQRARSIAVRNKVKKYPPYQVPPPEDWD